MALRGLTVHITLFLIFIWFFYNIWARNLSREIHFPADFRSNPDQTPLPGISNNPEDIDEHAQVCLIRVRAKLYRKVDLASQICESLS